MALSLGKAATTTAAATVVSSTELTPEQSARMDTDLVHAEAAISSKAQPSSNDDDSGILHDMSMLVKMQEQSQKDKAAPNSRLSALEAGSASKSVERAETYPVVESSWKPQLP